MFLHTYAIACTCVCTCLRTCAYTYARTCAYTCARGKSQKGRKKLLNNDSKRVQTVRNTKFSKRIMTRKKKTFHLFGEFTKCNYLCSVLFKSALDYTIKFK